MKKLLVLGMLLIVAAGVCSQDFTNNYEIYSPTWTWSNQKIQGKTQYCIGNSTDYAMEVSTVGMKSMNGRDIAIDAAYKMFFSINGSTKAIIDNSGNIDISSNSIYGIANLVFQNGFVFNSTSSLTAYFIDWSSAATAYLNRTDSDQRYYNIAGDTLDGNINGGGYNSYNFKYSSVTVGVSYPDLSIGNSTNYICNNPANASQNMKNYAIVNSSGIGVGTSSPEVIIPSVYSLTEGIWSNFFNETARSNLFVCGKTNAILGLVDINATANQRILFASNSAGIFAMTGRSDTASINCTPFSIQLYSPYEISVGGALNLKKTYSIYNSTSVQIYHTITNGSNALDVQTTGANTKTIYSVSNSTGITPFTFENDGTQLANRNFLVYMGASGSTANNLEARNAGTGADLFVNQDGNGIAINIDSEATSATTFNLDTQNTSGKIIDATVAGVEEYVLNFDGSHNYKNNDIYSIRAASVTYMSLFPISAPNQTNMSQGTLYFDSDNYTIYKATSATNTAAGDGWVALGGSQSTCIGLSDSAWGSVSFSTASYVLHNDTRTYPAGTALISWTCNVADVSSDISITFCLDIDGINVANAPIKIDNADGATSSQAQLRYIQTFAAGSHNVKVYANPTGTHNVTQSLITVCITQ